MSVQRPILFAASLAALAAGCKARPERGAAGVKDEVSLGQPEDLGLQPFDAVQTGARRKADGSCIPGPAAGAWAADPARVVATAVNLVPAQTTLDSAPLAAADPAVWLTPEPKETPVGTQFVLALKAADQSPRILLDRFGPKDPHGVNWAPAGALAKAFDSAYALAAPLGMTKAGLVVGRRVVSAKKPAGNQALPPGLAATEDTYKRCGDAVVSREVVARDLPLIVLAKDGKYERARDILTGMLLQRSGDALENELKAEIAAKNILVRVVWQEAGDPIKLLDDPAPALIEAYVISADVGVKSQYYQTMPVAAFKTLDDAADQPGAGGAKDVTAAIGAAATGRLGGAASAAESDAFRAPLAALETAVADCAGARFNAACKRLAAATDALLSAVPAGLRTAIAGGGAPIVTTRDGCKKALRRGETLRIGEPLCSANGKFTIIPQPDDHLVVYDVSAVKTDVVGEIAVRTPKWASNTNSIAPIGTGLKIELDGNMRLLAKDGAVLWESGTAGKGAVSLTVSDDGFAQLTVDADKSEVWNSKVWNPWVQGTLDREPMCGTTKGRVRHALEFIERKPEFDKMETAFSIGQAQQQIPDNLMGPADFVNEVSRLNTRGAPEATGGSLFVADLLGDPAVFNCIAALDKNDAAAGFIQLADVQKALFCARRPKTNAGDCPVWTDAGDVTPDSGTWKRLELSTASDLPERFPVRTAADADKYCKDHGKRLPVDQELTSLLQDAGVMGKAPAFKPLKFLFTDMVFLTPNEPRTALVGLGVATNGFEQGTGKRFVYVLDPGERGGWIKSDPASTAPVAWLCVSERNPPIP